MNNKDKALLHAIRKGVLSRVIAAVKAGASVNCVTDQGHSPLHVACGSMQESNLPIVKYLLSEGADINKVGPWGTPLHIAVNNTNLTLVKYLAAHKGINMNVQDDAQETALHKAAFYVSSYAPAKEIYHLLIAQGIDQAVRNYENQNAAEIFEITSSVPKRQEIIKSYEDFLFIAIREGDIFGIKKALRNLEAVNFKNSYGETPLHAACKLTGQLQAKALPIAKLLIERGADINEQGYGYDETALFAASYYGNYALVKYLLDNGADITFQNKTYRETALHQAASAGKVDIFNFLAERGAALNAQDINGCTASQILEEVLSVTSAEMAPYLSEEETFPFEGPEKSTTPTKITDASSSQMQGQDLGRH